MFIRITVSLLLILAACSTSINAVAVKPSCECTTVYIQAPPPVCGDGIEYMDDCRAKCAGAKTITAGPCPTKASAADCVCPMNYEPVCGSDGRTYPNACTAGCASVSVVSRGPCHCDRCPKVNKPVCGSDGETYSNECMARCAGVDIAKNGHCGCICPFIYEPVCANGKTYGNICEAQCANVKDTVAGECKK